MIAADAEICRLWWYDGLGIYGKQEFAGADPSLKRNAVFYYVHEHPKLPVNGLDWAQRGIDGIGSWNTVASLMKERYAGLKSFSFHFHEMRGLFVDKGEPRPVILIGVANVNVSLENEFLDHADDFGAILTRGDLD